jgi:uncharacterized protein
MAPATIERVVESLRALMLGQGRGFSVLLHGGEPLLLSKPDMALLLRGLRARLDKDCTLGLQTNGVLLDDDHIELFAETRTKVGVSLDGPAENHDTHRFGHDGRGSYEPAVAAVRRLLAHPRANDLFGGTLSVVDVTTDPAKFYEFFKELGVRSINVLLRDGNHSRLPEGKTSFDSTEYGDWFTRLWEHYLADPNPIAVECLDDLFRCLLGRPGKRDDFGLSGYGILVIDTDGTIAKNDTLKNSHHGADRFDQSWSVHTHDLHEVVKTLEFERYVRQQYPSHPDCLKCPIIAACGGGLVLHRWSDDQGYDNPSVYCHDTRRLADCMVETLRGIIPWSEPHRS